MIDVILHYYFILREVKQRRDLKKNRKEGKYNTRKIERITKWRLEFNQSKE